MRDTYVGEPEPKSDKIEYTWDNSFDFDQDAFDYYIDEDGGKVSGVVAFFVNGNGTITVVESAE